MKFQWPIQLKDSAASPVIVAATGTGKPVEDPFSNDNAFIKEGVMKNATVYACVDTLADGVASVVQNWQLFRRVGSNLVEIDDHPLLDLLNRPNDTQGAFAFWYECVAAQQITGNSYTERVNAESSALPLELWNHPPQQMSVIPGHVVGMVERYVLSPGKGATHPFPPENIMHRKLWNPENRWLGMSPLRSATIGLASYNESMRWYRDLLRNNGAVPFALQADKSIPDDQLQRIKELLRDEVFGKDRAGIEYPVFDGIHMQKIGLGPGEIAWISGLKFNVLEICKAYDVPPEIVGIPDAKTFSNYQEARKSLYTETIIPAADRLVDDLNNWLTPLFGTELEIAYNLSMIPAIQEEQGQLWDRAMAAVRAGLITINEARDMMNLDAIRDGDVRFEPLNALPIQTQTKGVRKALDFNVEADRTKRWKVLERQRDPWYDRVGKLANGRFDDERDIVAEAVADSVQPEEALARAETAIDMQRDEWIELLLRVYTSVAEPFALDEIQNLTKSKGPISIKQQEEEAWEATVEGWLRGQAAAKVADIEQTTKSRIGRTLANGISEGETIDDLARRVRSEYNAFSPARSVRIARTEVAAASNLGSFAGAQATGLALKKFWLDSGDDDVRQTHNHTDIAPVLLSEPFTLTDSAQLMFPGDTSLGAGAADVINCRCAVGYEDAI